MKKELVIVLDFGGQYNQLVARRVRECNVYCEIYSYKTDLEKIKAMNPKGIILTGGPNSCYEADSPTYSKELFELGIPVLGLCYGAQLMMHVLGGKVEKADHREYGKTEVLVDKTSSKIFEGVSEKTICWMSHFDYISQVAPGFEITSHTDNCPCASSENAEKGLYAIQFHPEVLHTQEGSKMLYNFVRGVCGCCGDWRMDNFVEEQIKAIRHLLDVFVAANNLDIVDAQRKYQQQLINLEPKIEEAKFAVESAHSPFIGGSLIEQIHDHEKYLNRKEYLNQLLVKRKEIEVNLSLIQDYIHKAMQ